MPRYMPNGQIIDDNGVGRIKCCDCGDQFQPRNFTRHRKSCLRKQRARRKSHG